MVGSKSASALFFSRKTSSASTTTRKLTPSIARRTANSIQRRHLHHGNAHLADGFVKGKLIECAKHNGRFDVTDGSPQRLPVCVALKTYKVREHDGKIFLDLASAGGCGISQPATTYKFRVVSNDNIATFIKELVLEPEPGSPPFDYKPGDYMQSTFPPMAKFRSIKSQCVRLSAMSGKANMFSTSALKTISPSAATIRWPPIPRWTNNFASTFALPLRRAARTASLAQALLTSTASSPAIPSPRSDRSGIFTSSPAKRKWSI